MIIRRLDANAVMAEAEAALAQAKIALERGVRLMQDIAPAQRLLLAEGVPQREEFDLHRFVCEQVNLAQQKPGLPAAEIRPDAMTTFARRIRRRRTLI